MPITFRSGRTAAASSFEPAAGPYKLRQGVPEPLSRQALQRMRRPTSQDAKLEFAQMTSDSFKRIHYELLRYCHGEIDGLSVLIAGQRGAGKTTLAKLVIQRVMIDSDGLIPLPLFLHGPTIIDPEAVTSELKGDDVENDAPREKQRALRQIVTALYRSLSTAIYDAWLNAAEEAPDARRAQRELLGLRAHLDLRLERAPDPDVLRKIWSRAGFLNYGVAFYLRPMLRDSDEFTRKTETPQIAGHKEDQGLREIVALAACADAYRVILGKTQEKLRREENAEETREQRAPSAAAGEGKRSPEDAKAKPGGEKSTTEKLAPAAFGTAAGGLGIASLGQGSTGIAIAIGIAVWLVSWVAMAYGVRRSRQETGRELTIDVDWSVDRLERDLPVLLKRVKDAGFAPIFVLDELDKAMDAAQSLEKFLKLAKHIVTDQAAFLFLTNRDYYEQLITTEQIDMGHAS